MARIDGSSSSSTSRSSCSSCPSPLADNDPSPSPSPSAASRAISNELASSGSSTDRALPPLLSTPRPVPKSSSRSCGGPAAAALEVELEPGGGAEVEADGAGGGSSAAAGVVVPLVSSSASASRTALSVLASVADGEDAGRPGEADEAPRRSRGRVRRRAASDAVEGDELEGTAANCERDGSVSLQTRRGQARGRKGERERERGDVHPRP